MKNLTVNGVPLSKRTGRLLAAMCCLSLLGIAGCVTPQMHGPVSPQTLENIPTDTRVEVVTEDGQKLKLRITRPTTTELVGRDRHFREYRLARKDIKKIVVPVQRDWPVAIAWGAIVLFAI